MRIIDWFKRKTAAPEPPATGVPAPAWHPEFAPTIDEVVDRMRYYTDGSKDIAVFNYGTCVVLPDGLTEPAARSKASEVLSAVFNFHPDMYPTPMDDGNILVQYNHPAFNVVLSKLAKTNMDQIRQKYLSALAPSEVILTPGGPNQFDEVGMMALYGRCFMFMDAQDPRIVRIVRHQHGGNEVAK